MASTGTVSFGFDDRPVLVRGTYAAAVAVALNGLLALAASWLSVAPGFEPLTLHRIVAATVMAVAGATGVYALIGSHLRRPDLRFVQVASGVLGFSSLPVLALYFQHPAATEAGIVLLVATHGVVAVSTVGALVTGDG
jgi:hypothetical protein